MSIAVAAIPSPYIHISQKRRKNIWYTIADGNWSDPNIWMSNVLSYSPYINFTYPGQDSARLAFPRVGDDVYINHTVTLDSTAYVNATVNNIYISGTLKSNNNVLTLLVNGDFQCTGALDLTASNLTIELRGVNNFINSYTSGGNSTIIYSRNGTQPIMDLAYHNLTVGSTTVTENTGIKYATANIAITGAMTVNASGFFELGTFNYSATGTTSMGSSGTFSKTGTGSVLFIGQLASTSGIITLSGNPTVEMRGGYNLNAVTFSSGTGAWSFTTNNQNISEAGGTYQFNGAVLVVGAITVSHINSTIMQINVSLDGTVAGSTFVNANGTLYLNSTTLPMVTGVFTRSNTSGTIGYVMNASYTLPYTSYAQALFISGTGTKTLVGTTTLSGALSIASGATLDASTFDLTITGVTSGAGKLQKTGAGNVLFIGLMNLTGANSIDFSGNPTVEMRGSMSSSISGNANMVNSGTGLWSFTTNNQTIGAASVGGIVFDGNVLISGAITVTVRNSITITFNGTVDGNNASSTLVINQPSAMNYKNATAPMVTGILDASTNTNVFTYNKAGNQDMKAGTYKSLTLAGSGAKKLLGNVSVLNTYTLTAPATLDSNGFALTNP